MVGVADCGIGIPASLRRNPDFSDALNDADAIALATELHITGTGEAHRGIGLDHVMSEMKNFAGSLAIVFTAGSIAVTAGADMTKNSRDESDRLPGVVAVVTISVPA